MFNDSKYTTWYYLIISRAQSRPKESNKYYERHHIIPRSLGGSNQLENLVWLTAREHYLCHLLLIKMTTGKLKSKMYYAFIRMSSNSSGERYTSKSFGFFKDTYAIIVRGENHHNYGRSMSPEAIEKRSASVRGKPKRKHSEESRRARSENHPRTPMTEEHKERLREIAKQPRSEEHKRKIAAAMKGKGKGIPKSEETRAKMSAAKRAPKCSL